MKLRRIAFVVVCVALGCNESPDVTFLDSSRARVNRSPPIATATPGEPGLATGVIGVRAEPRVDLRGKTKTLLDGAITSAPVTRMTSASYRMISTVHAAVE